MKINKILQENIIEDEILDLVDENDNVIKSMFRSEIYEKNLTSHIRAVWLMIKNKNGQLWIPRRSYKKKLLPGYLDGSVVGHVKSGESYKEALIREGIEEINIDLSNHDLKFLGKLTPLKDNVFCFFELYEITCKVAPKNWCRNEFCEASWKNPQELFDAIKNGEKAKGAFPQILTKFYGCK